MSFLRRQESTCKDYVIMKQLKLDTNYTKVKIGFYFLGIIITIFSILKFGLVDSHTPPLGFALPVIIMIIGSFGLIIDWLLSRFLKKIQIDLTSHYLGVFLNFIICILILYLD